MGKLQTIWLILRKNDWILFRYDIKNETAYPFDLYLPHGFSAHYTEEGVLLRKITKL